MAPNLFRVLLALVALYALLRGRRDERQVGIIFVVGVIATELVLPPRQERFEGVETHLMLVDVAVFLGFSWVAIRSERFWPLWIAGLQLVRSLLLEAKKDATAACNSAFQSYVGIAYSKSRYTLTYVVPASATWPGGDRALHCMVYYATTTQPAGVTLHKSLKGAVG